MYKELSNMICKLCNVLLLPKNHSFPLRLQHYYYYYYHHHHRRRRRPHHHHYHHRVVTFQNFNMLIL